MGTGAIAIPELVLAGISDAMHCAAARTQSGPTANVYADAPESSDSSDRSVSRDPPRADVGPTDKGYADASESSDTSDLFQRAGQFRAQRARTNFVNDLGPVPQRSSRDGTRLVCR